MGEGRTMSESSLKANLRVLVEQAVQRIAADDRRLEDFRGVRAWRAVEPDQVITELPAFGVACTALGSIPTVTARHGAGARLERMVLQFVYRFLGDLSEPTFDPDIFETTWEAFWEELSEPEWTWIGLANLRNVRSDTNDPLDLGHGTIIPGRRPDELIAMGWSEGYMERLLTRMGNLPGGRSENITALSQG